MELNGIVGLPLHSTLALVAGCWLYVLSPFQLQSNSNSTLPLIFSFIGVACLFFQLVAGLKGRKARRPNGKRSFISLGVSASAVEGPLAHNQQQRQAKPTPSANSTNSSILCLASERQPAKKENC